MNVNALVMLVLLSIMAFSNFSCKDKDKHYNIDMRIIDRDNSYRESLGIRKVNKEWFFYGDAFNAQVWKLDSSGYACKKVQRDGHDKIIWEEDYYYSGNTFPTFKAQISEFIVAHYDYANNKLTIDYLGTNKYIKDEIDKINNSSARNIDKYQKLDGIFFRYYSRQLGVKP